MLYKALSVRIVPDENCFCMSTRLGGGCRENLETSKKLCCRPTLRKLNPPKHTRTCTLDLVKCKRNDNTPNFKHAHRTIKVKC